VAQTADLLLLPCCHSGLHHVLLTWFPAIRLAHQLGAELLLRRAEFSGTRMDRVMHNNDRLKSSARLLEQIDKSRRQVVAAQAARPVFRRWYTLREHLAAARQALVDLCAR
jgi:hypothetical protein